MKLRRCLACGSKKLTKVLDLGKQPLANNYGESKKYPLVLNGCHECGHGQLSVSVSPKKLYSHYLYESGTSETLKKWFDKFAKKNIDQLTTVLDIASNDGSFLRACKKYTTMPLQGIDPAKNLVPDDIPTKCAFFNKKTKLGSYSVITAFNVVAHTPNPLGVLLGIKNNLAPFGKAFIMTSQASMYDTGQFDTIYHEHHSYFTPESMMRLVQRAGMQVTDITYEPIHGGSMLTTIRDNRMQNFDWFSEKANEVISKVKNAPPSAQKVVAVGAAAKGVVFINATGFKPEVVADEASIKWGHTIPGTDIPIVSLKELASYDEPLTVVILAWNFYDELVKKVKKVRPRKKDNFVRFFK